MSRGLTDEPELPEETNADSEMDNIINELIKGQNKLHDRLVDLERKYDYLTNPTNQEASAEIEAADRKFWKRGL
jgi:hypothetical protein